MSFTLELNNMRLVVLMHCLEAYVVFPSEDKEERAIIQKSKAQILGMIREEMGREIKGVTFLSPV